MKSGYYIAIFFVVAVAIGAALVFNARTITQISDNVVITQQTPVASHEEQNKVATEQKKINVMKDADIESDANDLVSDEDVDLSDMGDLMTEEAVTF